MSTKQMPDVIYHYTSNDVLLKILESRSLRLAARHHLNDSMEGEQFYSLLKTHTCLPSDHQIESIRKALHHLEFFVTCFSSCGDLLSQWRGYAGNGAGVAIGFKKQAISNAIKGSREALLYKVAYVDNWLDFQTINPDRATTVTAMLTSPGTPSPEAIQAFAKERWAIKSKGFAEEQESRLIVTIDATANTMAPITKGFRIDYMATSSEIREFCEFRFDVLDDLDFIDSITLGPNNKTSKDALRRCLAGFGMSHIKIQNSAISYR